ncbi:hypothetical protein H2O64_18845 [Kordia sp. YSTF-M3]|uniref:Gliding motility-associated protein GldM N-terminal domain-containing protein n=1 Tax=Kordia aestuariivivens TaxID=2759037 RepID=A0ABR7QEJ8_9FLAO|nr:hypothetical protein [Kordia aestuariivivens]MBC8756739.1 hypothetical protein [Kordia aestuariivivens]
MSKKVFLVTVLIVSLLLIGLMLLVADARSTNVLERFSTIEEKFIEANESVAAKVDSLQKQLETSTEAIPEIVLQFNAKADELLANILLIKKELIPNGLTDYNYEDPEIAKNNVVFFLENGQHSEKASQFLAKIEAYENIVAIIHLEFPKTNTQKFKLRTDIRENEDWLSYNFKGFPVIASYVKLTTMENDIKNKKEIIFNAVLKD